MDSFTPSEEFIRYLMLYHFLKEESATLATENICNVLGEVLTINKCQRWFRKFRIVNFDLKDIPKSGRPCKVDTVALAVEVESDPTASIEKLAIKLGYSWSSVKENFKKIGKLWRRGRWVTGTVSAKRK